MNEKERFSEVEKKLQEMASPGIRPGLARLARLLSEAGMPQDKFPSVHVAGTNGKGSTAASLYAILRKSTYKTALYTSPHLVDFSERLLIDDKRVSAERWLAAVGLLERIIKKTSFFTDNLPTYFELITAAAILILAEESPDIAVFEAGMGGRLDASNILGDVRLSLIVPIGLDHTEYLGDTLEKVAAEKFAIMRRDTPALFAGDPRLDAQFIIAAKLRGATPHIFSSAYSVADADYSLSGTDFTLRDKEGGGEERYHTPLVGTFQSENAALAAAAARLLSPAFPKITAKTIKEGLAGTLWPGRMEVIAQAPPVIVDGGHNPHAMRRIAETLKTLMGGSHVNIVIAMMHDKEIAGALSFLRGLDVTLYCTEVPGNERSLGAREMERAASEAALRSGGSFHEPLAAIAEASKEGAPVLCCGSLFLVGYIKERKDELRRI